MGKDVIVALDFPGQAETLAFLDRFERKKPFVKIGMELFYATGPEMVREIRARGHKIFLDLKLHDIPTTVRRAMAALSALEVDMCNLHASGATAMMQAALEFPDVTFVSCTGDQAGASQQPNLKNIFPYTYESRYVSGVVAGMKLKELMDAGTVTDPKIGYVGAYPYAEVVCGYTAFLLGIQSIVPEAYMEVQYTSSWYDLTAEGEAANQLMADGCVIIGQHADSTGAPSAVQAKKDAGEVVYSVGYNIDMLEAAPTAALTSSQNNWSVLYHDTLEKFLAGEEIPTDYSVGITEDAVMISKLGPECAEGTQEAVDAAWAGIKDGSLQVFDTSKFTCQPSTDGTYQVDADGHVTSCYAFDLDGDFVNDEASGEAIVDGAFQESVLRSAPYFALRIDGITELNNN